MNHWTFRRSGFTLVVFSFLTITLLCGFSFRSKKQSEPAPQSGQAAPTVQMNEPAKTDDAQPMAGMTIVPGQTSAPMTTTIMVNTVNDPPTLEPLGDKKVGKGTALDFNVQAKDPDNTDLTYSLQVKDSADKDLNPQDLGMTLDEKSGAFHWTPKDEQVGMYKVTFKVSDGTQDASESISIQCE